jgi:hypothetical protein
MNRIRRIVAVLAGLAASVAVFAATGPAASAMQVPVPGQHSPRQSWSGHPGSHPYGRHRRHAWLADHPHRRRGRAARRRASRSPGPGVRRPAAHYRKRLGHDRTAQFRSSTPAGGLPPKAGNGHPTPGLGPIGYPRSAAHHLAHSRHRLWPGPISGRQNTLLCVHRPDGRPDAPTACIRRPGSMVVLSVFVRAIPLRG